MRKLLALLLAGAVLTGPLPLVSAADNSDELWTPISSPTGEGWRSLFISESNTLNREPSALYAELPAEPGSKPLSYHCANLDSPKCVELPRIFASAFLLPCSVSNPTNCIESFYAVTPSGLLIDAISPYEYPTSAAWNFEGDLLKNLPAGGSPTIWNIPGVAHGGGESSYMVQAFTTGFLNKAASAKVTTERFVLNQITVNVAPVKIVNGRYVRQFAQDSTQTSPGTNRGVRHDSIDEWRNCAMIDNGSCAQRQSFPEGYRFGVKVRMQEKLTGWLHGRIYNPNVSITTSALNEQLIEVVASPIRVPVVGQWFKWSELTPAIQNYILSGKVQGGQGNQESKSLATGNYQEIVNTSGSEALEALALWLPQIKDRASATPSTWTFKSLEGFELATANSCIKDAKDLVGFVTTNAAAYSAGPPTFNSELQSLDYKVIAPHFTAKGEIFAGTYDLRIRGEVARCIYGFDKSPIRASISILSEDGSTQTATQTINEDNGWLSLSANGFTYSAPTIQVKLSQSTQAVVDTATVTSAATPAPVVKKTVTCIKGKVKKVIRGVAPHCPKGFKAKR